MESGNYNVPINIYLGKLENKINLPSCKGKKIKT